MKHCLIISNIHIFFYFYIYLFIYFVFLLEVQKLDTEFSQCKKGTLSPEDSKRRNEFKCKQCNAKCSNKKDLTLHINSFKLTEIVKHL